MTMDCHIQGRVSEAVAAPSKTTARHLPLPRLLPALLSAGLLWACYFPLAWGWLAWVALGLHVLHPGRPYRLTLSIASGEPQALGVGLIVAEPWFNDRFSY